MMKNKTLASCLALVLGPLGLHRFYLYGIQDSWAWIHPLPTALGLYGVQRANEWGLDDRLSWVLIPFLGFGMATCALTAIVYGLTSTAQWNARHNPQAASNAPSGRSNWLTVGIVALALFIGATALLSSLVLSVQRYFEYQIEAGQQLTQ